MSARVSYREEAMASARACACSYGIKDEAEIEAIAKQFEHDFRRSDELRAMAEGRA